MNKFTTTGKQYGTRLCTDVAISQQIVTQYARAKEDPADRMAARPRKPLRQRDTANGQLVKDREVSAAVAAGFKPGRVAEQAGLKMSKDVVVQAMIAERSKDTARLPLPWINGRRTPSRNQEMSYRK